MKHQLGRLEKDPNLNLLLDPEHLVEMDPNKILLKILINPKDNHQKEDKDTSNQSISIYQLLMNLWKNIRNKNSDKCSIINLSYSKN